MQAAEAILLGLSSGPACLASCGPVLLPWLAAENAPLAKTTQLLGLYLGGRFVAYLVFGIVAGIAGALAPPDAKVQALLFGAANLGVAILLAWYSFRLRPAAMEAGCGQACGGCPAGRGRWSHLGPASLGLVTGLNLCPPFIAATARAAQGGSLAYALLFFVFFFLGTTAWFLPLPAIGLLRRTGSLILVARITMGLLAVYYGYLGLIAFVGRLLYA